MDIDKSTSAIDPIHDLLLKREIRALKILNAARALLVAVMTPMGLVFSYNHFERLSTTLVVLAYGAIVGYLAVLINKRRLRVVGLVGASLDVITLAALVVIWKISLGGAEVPAGFTLKSELTAIALLLMTLNSLAMRPLYPVIVASGALVIQFVLLSFSLMDDRTAFTASYLDAFSGPAVSIGQFATSVVVIAFVAIVLATLSGSARKMIIEGANLEKANVQLRRYFSPNLVPKLIENPRLLHVGAERRELSFVFTDLEGFTSLVEKTDPSAMTSVLNEYLDKMVQIAFKHEGTVDKVVGDAVHVLFGAPVAQSDHAARAVACALEMDSTAQRIMEDRGREIALGRTRIGVNSGYAVVGNFGGAALFDYTAHGDAINVAARLEKANKQLGTRICVSAETASRIPDFRGRPVGALWLKGKSESLEVYEPLTEAHVCSPANRAYLEAVASLKENRPDAVALFESLVEQYPDDPLAVFHLNRIAGGESGYEIAITEN